MKKRVLLSLCMVVGCILSLNAQDKKVVDNLSAYKSKTDTLSGWQFKGVTGVTFGQTSLTNWSAGGENTVSINAILNATANYRKGHWFWDNNLSAEYGMIYSSTNDWQKSADKINLNSIAGREMSKKWSGAFLLNFYTQFSKGYNYPDKDNHISTFMAPGYLDGALGFTYKPNKDYTIFVSPLAERATFVLDNTLSDQGAFGVDPGKKTKWETGAYLMANSNQTIVENLQLITVLDMFTPYTEDFGNVNINWNVLLSYKFNKLFTASLNTTLRYYDKEIQKVQFKEIFGLGFTYNF